MKRQSMNACSRRFYDHLATGSARPLTGSFSDRFHNNIFRGHGGHCAHLNLDTDKHRDVFADKTSRVKRFRSSLTYENDMTRAIIHETIESIRSLRKSFDPSVSVGFVPTMGALHEGHLSLARAARSENDVVVSSIFVNPTQFGEGEDLDKYPRQLEKDVDLLTEIGVDHIFVPSSEMMYGKNHVTFVEPTGFEHTREGLSRPSHFRGVATIVTKLFNIVQPTNAYFGQKDAAQGVLIRRIVDDLDMDVNVQIMDTVREKDGLAMSSRNAYLTPEERGKAGVIFQALMTAREMFESRLARGTDQVDASDLEEVVKNILHSEPLITEIQYVAVDDLETMQPLSKVSNSGCIVSLACILGSVRLIDNIVLR
ncbi:hypothetical protein ACHAWF_005125 [Thalassiosira exigua]